MKTPSISIATPTYNREQFLPLIYKSIIQQTTPDWEWIIIDDSDRPSEFIKSLNSPNINYHHLSTRLSIGEKRNLCSELAQGKYIAHFDDDEYYAPHYLDSMIKLLELQQSDILKLSGFFIYSKIYHKFAYWNLLEKTGIHYIWSPEAMVVGTIEYANPDLMDNHLGYGFSYVYKRSVSQTIQFEPVSFNEDALFIKAAMNIGFKTQLLADDVGLCIHILHMHNTSKCFPQYILPTPIVKRLFSSLPIEIFN